MNNSGNTLGILFDTWLVNHSQSSIYNATVQKGGGAALMFNKVGFSIERFERVATYSFHICIANIEFCINKMHSHLDVVGFIISLVFIELQMLNILADARKAIARLKCKIEANDNILRYY